MQISSENTEARVSRGGRVFSKRIAFSPSALKIVKPTAPQVEEASPLFLSPLKNTGLVRRRKNSLGQSGLSGLSSDTSTPDKSPVLKRIPRVHSVGDEEKIRERLKSIDSAKPVPVDESARRRSSFSISTKSQNLQASLKLNSTIESFAAHISNLSQWTESVENGNSNFFKLPIPHIEKLDQVHWIANDSEQNELERPLASVDSTFTACGHKVYLYAGATQNGLSNELWSYHPFKGQWKKRDSGKLPRRKGHSSVMVRNSMYVFGGEVSGAISSASITQLSNDVLCYTPTLNQWNIVNSATPAKDSITPRKHHAMCRYKNFLFVYGGIVANGMFERDLWIFDVDQRIWKKLNVKRGELDSKGIAYHSMVSVFDENVENSNKTEGFYVFGGRNEKGEAINVLKKLSYENGSYELRWSYPTTKGKGPNSRFQHTMVYFAPGRCLLVYGGKYEMMSNNHCHDDIKVLSLDDLTWMSPRVSGQHLTKDLFGHSACELNGQMIVFGGMTKGQFTQNKAEVLELRQNEVKRLVQKNMMEEVQAKYQESQKLKEKVILENIIKESENMQKTKLTDFSDYEQDPAEESTPQHLRKNQVSRFLTRNNNAFVKRKSDRNNSYPFCHVSSDTLENAENTNNSLLTSVELPKIHVLNNTGKLTESHTLSKLSLNSTSAGKTNSSTFFPSIKESQNNSLVFQTESKDDITTSSTNNSEEPQLVFRTLSTGSQILLNRGAASPMAEMRKYKPANQRFDSFKSALKC